MTGVSHGSVFERFEETATTFPDRDILQTLPSTAQVYGIQAQTLSYAEVLRSALDLSEAFEKAGYERGMRVALLLENRPVFFVMWLALNRLGVSVVPINPDLRLRELEFILGHSQPALILAIPARLGELMEAAKAARVEAEVIVSDTAIPPPCKGAIVAEVLMGEDQEAALLYTSGTTGHPKGCVLPNTYFLLAGQWYGALGGIAQLSREGERMITPLPIFHMNAMAYSFMAMIEVGGCLIALDRFHPKLWWSDVAQSKATCLHYLGVMPSILMAAEPSDRDQTHGVRFGFGAGVDPKLHASFEARFGFPLVEAWAMTETGAGAVIASNTHDRPVGQSSLGIPARELDYCIMDEQGQKAQINAPGELWVRRRRAPHNYGFFSHYYKDPDATAKAWEGGWFHTGDMVRQDGEGRLFFVDRKKNVIRRSGENIAAVEVESVLLRHPMIDAVAVTSVPDALRGDEVFACIKAQAASKELAFEITEWCLGQMAYYKAPGFIAFVDELPLTPTHKIQRGVLKTLAAKLLDHAGTIKTAHLKMRKVAS